MTQADLLRKAIGKKVPEIMDEQRSLFVEGCKKNNIPYRIATQIFDLIEYFSGYGFNKSHSTAYALISYRTAFLKANYPVEFMAALLTSERNNTDKVVEYVHEANRMGIKVLPPDINTSFVNFTVVDEKNIRFGLMAIKNVGKAALENIIKVRQEKKFESFFDFCERVDSRAVNKKVIESLIKVGAMDSFGLKRSQMMAILDKVLSKTTRKKTDNQLFLFSLKKEEEDIPQIEEWPLFQILEFEKNLLGMYVSSHPLNSYQNILKYLSREKILLLYEMESKDEITVCGIVDKIKIIPTRKSGERMAILRIEDESGNVEVFVFPKLFEENIASLKEKNILVIKGKLESKEKTPKLLATKIVPLNEVLNNIKEINIIIENNIPLEKLKDIFINSRGEVPVFFILNNSKLKGVKIKTGEQFFLQPSERVFNQISSLIGEGNLSLTL
jgi:DNA polymerase-3 subunit alpha